ncbi:MAG: hypothetical protein D6705_06550 [Deltaproteobacteria bacterium]|nr:MAG: hypothetical protein D6705_06550 [Deltaproteobacteria bacterium]
MAFPRRVAVLLAYLLAGCGPQVATSGDTGGGTGEATTSGTSGPGTSAGTTAGETCPPIVPEVVTADFSIEPAPPMGTGRFMCVVLSVENTTFDTTVALTCGGPPDVDTFTVRYGALGHLPPDLSVDDGVVLTTSVEMGWWENRWFALHRPEEAGGNLLAAGVDASVLDPPEAQLDEILADATVAVVDGLCEDDVESWDCSPARRLGLRLSADGATVQVVAPGDGRAGPYAIFAESALVFVPPVECFDYPDAWFDFVIERTP